MGNSTEGTRDRLPLKVFHCRDRDLWLLRTKSGVQEFVTASIELSGPCELGLRLTASNSLPLFHYQLHKLIQ